MFNFKAAVKSASNVVANVSKKATEAVNSVRNTNWNEKMEDVCENVLESAAVSANKCGDRWAVLAKKYEAEGNHKKAAYCMEQAEKSYERSLKAAEDLAAKETVAEPETAEEIEAVVEVEAEEIPVEAETEEVAAEEEAEVEDDFEDEEWCLETASEILYDLKHLEGLKEMLLRQLDAGEFPSRKELEMIENYSDDAIDLMRSAAKIPGFSLRKLKEFQKSYQSIQVEILTCIEAFKTRI